MRFEKFLAMAFMCHQKPERSFHIRGKQFPICARCTGILVGYILGIIIACITRCANYLLPISFIIPMITDGVVQLRLNRESNNSRRFITGILGGISIIYIFISIHIFTVWLATIFLKYIELI